LSCVVESSRAMHTEQQGLMQGGAYGQGAAGYQNDGRGGYGPPGDGGHGQGGGYGGYGPTGGNPTGGYGGYGPTEQSGYGQGGGGGYGQGGGGEYGHGGGGAEYGGETKWQGGRQWKNSWFVAAFLMMCMSVFGLIQCFLSGQIVDAIEFFYLFLFSLVVVTDNMPFLKDAMKRPRYSIGIYVQALRRMTFLGLFLIFVGSSLIGAFCNNDTGGFLTTFGGIAGGAGVLVGLLSVFFGVKNSRLLEDLRAKFEQDAQYGQLENDFRTYAKHKQYLTPQEFVDMCNQKGVMWDPHYNMLIFNALSWDPNKVTLSQDAFMSWVRSPASCTPTLL